LSILTNGIGGGNIQDMRLYLRCIGAPATNTGSFYLDDIFISKSAGIAYSNKSSSLTVVTNNIDRVITFKVSTADSNGSVLSVAVNLTPFIGARPKYPLTNMGGNKWQGSWTIPAGTPTGKKV